MVSRITKAQRPLISDGESTYNYTWLVLTTITELLQQMFYYSIDFAQKLGKMIKPIVLSYLANKYSSVHFGLCETSYHHIGNPGKDHHANQAHLWPVWIIIKNNTISDPFPVNSGVRQDCILFPILFLFITDLIIHQKTFDQPRGIQWIFLYHLEDLDFANDVEAPSTNSRKITYKKKLTGWVNFQSRLVFTSVPRRLKSCVSASLTVPSL